MKEIKEKNSFLGLLPFIVFIFVYLGSGIILQMQNISKAFYQFPAPIAAIIGIIVAFSIFKGKFKDKMDCFLSGCGHRDILTMCFIYLLAGGFAMIAKHIGGVESAVNLGLTYIPVDYLTVGVFLIASFISTATGTSVGSIVSLGPIVVGLAEQSGISMAFLLASLMSGAIFGDNLSIISDTTIAATRTQNVDMKDKFRENIKIAAPAAIITIILLLVFGRPEVVLEMATKDYSLVKILPYLIVLILALIGVNVFVVLLAGILVAGIIGIKSGFGFLDLIQQIYNGFLGMSDIFLLSLLTGGLGEMVTKAGGIKWLMSVIEKKIKGKRTAQLGIGALVSLTDIAVANNTVAIIINGSIAKKISEKYKISPKRTAAYLDIFSCIFQGLIPYGAQMLIMLEFAKGTVSPLEVIPFLWYQILLGIFTIGYILFRKK